MISSNETFENAFFVCSERKFYVHPKQNEKKNLLFYSIKIYTQMYSTQLLLSLKGREGKKMKNFLTQRKERKKKRNVNVGEKLCST